MLTRRLGSPDGVRLTCGACMWVKAVADLMSTLNAFDGSDRLLEAV